MLLYAVHAIRMWSVSRSGCTGAGLDAVPLYDIFLEDTGRGEPQMAASAGIP